MMAPATDGRGHAAWVTRRRNAYRQALASVAKLAYAGDVASLVLCFGTITEFLAPAIPDSVTTLPRNYAWGMNSDQEPTFVLQGEKLVPGIIDPQPSLKAAQQFACDLTSGWLAEVGESLGLAKSIWFAEARR